MRPDVKLFLLKIGKFNGSIEPLTELGYEYAQILEMIETLVREHYLIKSDNSIKLTQLGHEEISRLNSELHRTQASKWIEPYTQSKIPKIDKKEVFLPNQNELSF